MSSAVERHVLERIERAELVPEPFPYFYAERILPPDYYAELLERLPPCERFICHAESGKVTKGAYKERFILPLEDQGMERIGEEDRSFFESLRSLVASRTLLGALIAKFKPFIHQRFAGAIAGFDAGADPMLVRDRAHYALGPHSDARHRLLSLLVYLPRDDAHPELGTALYAPKDPGFRCPGGPHYGFEAFDRIGLAPYRANCAFGFLKTDRSFHGVEAVAEGAPERRLLMVEAKLRHIRLLHPPAEQQAAG